MPHPEWMGVAQTISSSGFKLPYSVPFDVDDAVCYNRYAFREASTRM